MTESVLLRQRKRESLLTIVFTIFSIFMGFVGLANDWSNLFIPVIFAELGYVWWSYISGFKNYLFRAVALTLLTCLNIDFYGIHGVDFNNLIPTLCVCSVMLALYYTKAVMEINILNQVSLFLYHVFVKQTFVIPEDRIAVDRMALQLLSLVVLNLFCMYMVLRAAEEDEDVNVLERQIQRVEKIKNDFVANTSHELRTPINTISGMSEIILQEDLPEEVHHNVLDIQMTGIELQNIVADIMDYAALESGTMELNEREYNITSTLNDIMNVTVFQNRDKNLELIFDCDPNIPCLLYGDERQIRRVINNLIGNAIKFTAEGGVTVKVSYREEEYGANLIVRVRDTGIGLTDEEIEKIFQGFYQTDSDRNRQVEGMGLGLTISSSIVKKMGGFLNVKSRVGEGSEFYFAVPQKVVNKEPCIALTHPNLIQAIWYFNAEAYSSAIRDDYIDNIKNISKNLGIYLHRSASLGELKRRIAQTQFTHLIISMEEYREDPKFFNEISEQISTVLIMDSRDEIPLGGHLHIIYKPFNAMTIAELFNGGDVVAKPGEREVIKKFVAPSAKVLVVDDNLMNLKVVEGLLRKYRIRIGAATSGEEALKLIESQDFDFVFMDHMMPGMDGIECFHRIRGKNGQYFSQVPVIALTANAIAGSREMFLSEGFNDFIAKPIDNSVLERVLNKFIRDDKKSYVTEEETMPNVPSPKVEKEQDNFAAMEGIDMETALTYCGGLLEDYIDLARVYCDSSEKYINDLNEYFRQEDLHNYGIIVHALKSTSRTIGATKLADMAYTGEKAAKDGDAKLVGENHGPLMEEYEKILTVLRNNPEIFEKEEKKEEEPKAKTTSLDKVEWKELIAKLSDKISTFEGDAVETLLDEYENFTYKGKAVKELLASMTEKVADFDFEGAADELKRIGGEK